jgi:Arc/MetJ-type ribon-helix-helix transcriptional regulator
MSTISVPIPAFLEEFIKSMISSGVATDKADVVRKALIKMREDEAVNSVLRAEQDIREGELLEGDLDELVSVI